MRPWRPLALLAPLLSAACSEVGPANVKLAPGYTPAQTTVSVLGVFRDGRMSSDAWTPLGPPLSSALGQVEDICETAYGDRLQQENPDLFTFLEEDTRNNGITEEMLAKFAHQAQGEMILIVTVHGRIVAGARDDMPPQSAPAMRPGAAGQGMNRNRPGQRAAPSRSTAPGGLELAASLYSVRQQKSVARLNMAYSGTSVEDAFRSFAAAVATVVPGSTCKGWKWKDASSSPVPGLGLP